jgi:transposase-like protein
MPKRSYTPEQIIGKLREVELLIHKGDSAKEAIRKIGVSEYTYYRWRQEYGGMRIEQARKLKGLEKENARLKKLVAELSLDNDIWKEAARGNS